MPSPAMNYASPSMPMTGLPAGISPLDSYSASQAQPPMDPAAMAPTSSGGVTAGSPASQASGGDSSQGASGAFQMNPDGSVRQVGQKTSNANPIKTLLLLAAAAGAAVFGYNKFFKSNETPDGSEDTPEEGSEVEAAGTDASEKPATETENAQASEETAKSKES